MVNPEPGRIERREVEEAVISIVSDVASVERSEIQADTNLVDELDLDSLDLLEVSQRLEDSLNVRFRDDDLASARAFESIDALVNFVIANSRSSPLPIKHDSDG